MLWRRAVVQRSQEFVDPTDVAEADEERDRGVDHALGLGDHAGAAAEAGEPAPLAGMVPLEPWVWSSPTNIGNLRPLKTLRVFRTRGHATGGSKRADHRH